MKPSRLMPTTYLLIVLVLILLLHLLWPVARIIALPLNLLGILPLVAGIVLNLVADGAFHRVDTTVKPFEETSVLVTEGAFAITRHPMYLGFVLIVAGVALLLGSLTPWIVIVPFAIWLDRVYVRVEEQMLAEQFGQEWETYVQRTRRWI